MVKKLLSPLWGTAVAATLLVAGTACADDIPWSYAGRNSSYTVGNSTVDFIGKANNINGDSGVVIFNLDTRSTATTPDHFHNQAYSLNVNLSDTNSLGSGTESGTLTFTGTFSGDISRGAVKNFTNTPGISTGDLILGDDATGWRKYHVVLDSFTPPGPPGDPLGAIHASVTISPTVGPGSGGGGGGGPDASPEPTSMVLAGFGLSTIGLAALRRRKRKA